MRYKIFNGKVHEYSYGDPVPDIQYTGELVMAIDPSKTNCAVVIGDPGGQIISIIEMSGNNWGSGPVEDTTEYCSDIRQFIKELLAPAKMYKIGLEQAITKKGMMMHHSNMVLTEIRGAFLSLFWEEYHLTKDDVEVNNWTWKYAILPEGYRSPYEKGSMRYFYEYLKDYSYVDYYEDDVTDCMCIYKFLVKDTKDTYRIVCQSREKPRRKYTYAIMPEWADELGFRKFTYNPMFSLEENTTFFANRSNKNGVAILDLSRVTIEEIYNKASSFSDVSDKNEARLVVAVSS